MYASFDLREVRGDIAQCAGNGEFGRNRFDAHHIGYFFAKCAVLKIAEVHGEDIFYFLSFDFLLLALKAASAHRWRL